MVNTNVSDSIVIIVVDHMVTITETEIIVTGIEIGIENEGALIKEGTFSKKSNKNAIDS